MRNSNPIPAAKQGGKFHNPNPSNRWVYPTIRGQGLSPMTDIGRANKFVYCIVFDASTGITDVMLKLQWPVVMRILNPAGAWVLTRQASYAIWTLKGVAFWIAKEGGARMQPTLLMPYDEPFSKGTEARRMVLNPHHPDVQAGIDGNIVTLNQLRDAYNMKPNKRQFDSVTGRIASEKGALVRTQNANRRIALAMELLESGWKQKEIAAHPDINVRPEQVCRWFSNLR